MLRPCANTDTDLGAFDNAVHARRLDHRGQRVTRGLDLNNRARSKQFDYANATSTLS